MKKFLSDGAQIIAAFLFAFIISRGVIVHAQVVSSSMEGTIPTNGLTIGSRLSYVIGEPQRFDIIVFENPLDPSRPPFVKRIIGLPYETVEIRNGQVYINDSATPLDDSFTKEESFGNHGPFIVPTDSFFVLGDHRNNSLDSRGLPDIFIQRDAIIGRLFVTYFPNPTWFRRIS